MTVEELIAILEGLEPGAEVQVWDPYNDCKVPLQKAEVDPDGNVLLID